MYQRKALTMELVNTPDGEFVRIEYGNKTEIRDERKYAVQVSDKGVMVEAQPEG